MNQMSTMLFKWKRNESVSLLKNLLSVSKFRRTELMLLELSNSCCVPDKQQAIPIKGRFSLAWLYKVLWGDCFGKRFGSFLTCS